MRNAGLRLIAAWLLLSLVGFMWGASLLGHCRPLLHTVLELIAPDYAGDLSIVDESGQQQILFNARALQPLIIRDDLALPLGQSLPASAGVFHVLVPIVLLFSALSIWPARRLLEWPVLVLLALPAAALLLCFTTPFQLVGLIEMAMQSFAYSHGVARAEPWTLRWMLFMESGGSWLLSFTFAVACGVASRRLVAVIADG